MIGPVSGTGRAMMASLQQAIQKGMPPDQAIQYVKSMAMQGVAPMTDLYVMMNQFQRLKQQPVQAPQTPPTIRDQLNMAEMQQRQQQMAMQQGLGGMPAPVMDQAQFAGGGIVAFAAGSEEAVSSEGGMDLVSFVRARMPNFDMLTPEQKQEVLKQFDPIYRQAYAESQGGQPRGAVPEGVSPFSLEAFRRGPANAVESAMDRSASMAPPAPDRMKPVQTQSQVPAAPRVAAPAAPKGDMFTPFERPKTDLETVRAARIERQREAKTGEFSQADADLAAFIKEQKAQGGDTKEAYRNFWVMTGASLMANKSPHFMQALGESIRDNYGGLVSDLKQLKDSTKALRLQEIQLRRAQEQAMESGSAADQQRVDTLNEKADATNYDITVKRAAIAEKILDRRHDIALEKLRASNKSSNLSIAERLMGMYDAAVKEPDPAKRQQLMGEYERQLETAENITRATTAAGVGLGPREATVTQKEVAGIKQARAYKDAERRYNLAVSQGDTAGANAAAAAMQQMEARAIQQARSYLNADTGLSGKDYNGPYAGFSAQRLD